MSSKKKSNFAKIIEASKIELEGILTVMSAKESQKDKLISELVAIRHKRDYLKYIIDNMVEDV